MLELLSLGQISEEVAKELLPHPLEFYKAPPVERRGVKRQLTRLSETDVEAASRQDAAEDASAPPARDYVDHASGLMCLGLNIG